MNRTKVPRVRALTGFKTTIGHGEHRATTKKDNTMSKDYIDDIFEDFFPGMFDFWNRAVPASWNWTQGRKDMINKVANNGLKAIIGRPHDLWVSKDKDGNTVYRIQLCYTPFKKSDVQVEVSDKFLEVRIGLPVEKDEVVEEPKEEPNRVKTDGEYNKNEVKDYSPVKTDNGFVNAETGKAIYHGISRKPFWFKLYLKNLLDWQCDEEIDIPNITAKADDGMLELTIPTKRKVPENRSGKLIPVL